MRIICCLSEPQDDLLLSTRSRADINASGLTDMPDTFELSRHIRPPTFNGGGLQSQRKRMVMSRVLNQTERQGKIRDRNCNISSPNTHPHCTSYKPPNAPSLLIFPPSPSKSTNHLPSAHVPAAQRASAGPPYTSRTRCPGSSTGHCH